MVALPPLVPYGTTFAPVGSVSHDSQVAITPLRIVFPCHPAERWDYGRWLWCQFVFMEVTAALPPKAAFKTTLCTSPLCGRNLSRPGRQPDGGLNPGAAGA